MTPLDTTGLTPRQADLLRFIASEADHGRTPSVREMMEGIGCKGIAPVVNMLDALEERGRITRTPSRARTVSVVPADPFAGVSNDTILAEVARRGGVFAMAEGQAA